MEVFTVLNVLGFAWIAMRLNTVVTESFYKAIASWTYCISQDKQYIGIMSNNLSISKLRLNLVFKKWSVYVAFVFLSKYKWDIEETYSVFCILWQNKFFITILKNIFSFLVSSCFTTESIGIKYTRAVFKHILYISAVHKALIAIFNILSNCLCTSWSFYSIHQVQNESQILKNRQWRNGAFL